jgi:hypothetical protein
MQDVHQGDAHEAATCANFDGRQFKMHFTRHYPTRRLTNVFASFWVRVVISAIVLLAALYIILSRKFATDQEKWAFGVIGTILGYWLKV